jgi:membrane protease YdiL (CAAX protease family)
MVIEIQDKDETLVQRYSILFFILITFAWSWLYWIAIVLPFVEVFVILGAHVLFGVPFTVSDRPIPNYPLQFFTTLFIAGSLEEFGWRGFAQKQLQKSYSAF